MALSTPIHPPPNLLQRLKLLEPVFDKVQVMDVKAPEEVWRLLLKEVQKPKHKRNVNGCGSRSTEFIPDSIWGLNITAMCHIHDLTHHLSETKEDCDLSNALLLMNTVNYVNANSNILMAWLRRYRVMTYYNAVHLARTQFCKGYRS